MNRHDKELDQWRRAWAEFRAGVFGPIEVYAGKYLEALTGGYGAAWQMAGWLLFGVVTGFILIAMIMDTMGML